MCLCAKGHQMKTIPSYPAYSPTALFYENGGGPFRPSITCRSITKSRMGFAGAVRAVVDLGAWLVLPQAETRFGATV
jgi:hypothetical protein